MEQEPLEEITDLKYLTRNVHQMFAEVLKRGTMTKSWRMDVRLLSVMALDCVAEDLVDTAASRYLKLKWSVSGSMFTPYKTITAKVSRVDEGAADQWGIREAIDKHLGDRITGHNVTVRDDGVLLEGVLPFKHHEDLKKYLPKLRADMRAKGINIDFGYYNELGDTPVKYKLDIIVKPAERVEYKQLVSDKPKDLVDMIEWAENADASTMRVLAEAAASKSYAENGCLILSTGKRNILVEVGEWVTKIDGKVTGVISDEFKKHICGE